MPNLIVKVRHENSNYLESLKCVWILFKFLFKFDGKVENGKTLAQIVTRCSRLRFVDWLKSRILRLNPSPSPAIAITRCRFDYSLLLEPCPRCPLSINSNMYSNQVRRVAYSWSILWDLTIWVIISFLSILIFIKNVHISYSWYPSASGHIRVKYFVIFNNMGHHFIFIHIKFY